MQSLWRRGSKNSGFSSAVDEAVPYFPSRELLRTQSILGYLLPGLAGSSLGSDLTSGVSLIRSDPRGLQVELQGPELEQKEMRKLTGNQRGRLDPLLLGTWHPYQLLCVNHCAVKGGGGAGLFESSLEFKAWRITAVWFPEASHTSVHILGLG
ncbi:hypothetical protein TREES_T100009857 [Tupaia chinensis]|uniref:Uncharacterized protein n=1 Tax=Tupaia chinensis TaxID=246437 RepID=L9KQZ2_TUPCH|nr:hypothetical protein TREES_T100009857 [Tupaia chinensis]